MSRPTVMGGIPTPITFNPHLPSSRTGTETSASQTPSGSPSRNQAEENISRATTLNPGDQNWRVGTRTVSSPGPSRKEPESVTSTWGIGWQTPTVMLACYVLALVIALVHLLLFRYIDTRPADGPDRVAPQAYIATASNILANAFGFALRSSLAVAFIQHLWHLLRASAMKVSTIELLFTIRANPLLLFRWAAIKATPALCALALLMWGTQVATSFPPGAIEVVSVQLDVFELLPQIPTFNASFMGNTSGSDAAAFALNRVVPYTSATGDGFISDHLSLNNYGNLITRLSFGTLITGEALAFPSPCGVNCSFVTEFEGPYLNCDSTNTTTTINGNSSILAIYDGSWVDAPIRGYNGTLIAQRYNATTLTPLTANSAALTNGVDGNLSSVVVQQYNLSCLPERAKFTVNQTYLNNIPSKAISISRIGTLVNVFPATKLGFVSVPGFSGNGTTTGTKPANWSDYSLSVYRDLNHFSIINAMFYYLRGNYTASPTFVGNTMTSSATPGGNSTDLVWTDLADKGNRPVIEIANIVDRTRFNGAFHKFNRFEPANPQFNITQGTLNEALFNLTTSIILSYSFWNTTANATIHRRQNIYTFSSPLNLLLPYFLSLTLALPFVILGTFSLFKNGVAATDGGFMQIVTTSTGSAVLDRAAAGGCLGGNESAPKELKDLKIRFGEFIGRDEPGRVRKAGFGVESEVTDLKKGAKYGIARWI